MQKKLLFSAVSLISTQSLVIKDSTPSGLEVKKITVPTVTLSTLRQREKRHRAKKRKAAEYCLEVLKKEEQHTNSC